MTRFLEKMLLSVALLVMLGGTASAELLKGQIKAIAPQLQFFSLTISPEKVLLVAWDNNTVWKGINRADELKLDESVHVDVVANGDSLVAVSVSRDKTPLPAGIPLITFDSLTAGLEGKKLTLVDSRAVNLYDAGHIPGAVSLPLARLEKRTIGLLPESKTARLVFYDEGQGGESAGKAAVIANKAGYTDIAIFPEGAAGWVDAGKFLAASTTFIRKANPVIIDLRSPEQVALGHIAKAVNYPAATLKNYLAALPTDKLTPLVLYGNSDTDAVAAAQLLRKQGYRRITIYPGGADSWLKNAEVLKTGPAGQDSEVEATHSGMLSADAFKMALLSPMMVEVVDLRAATDHKKGNFPNAKHIPLQDLAKRLGELDRSKIQVVFAADPLLAEMAYDYLRSKEYRVNFLNGTVEFASDDAYTVKEK